jgi:hypothetical protein
MNNNGGFTLQEKIKKGMNNLVDHKKEQPLSEKAHLGKKIEILEEKLDRYCTFKEYLDLKEDYNFYKKD